MVSRSRLKMLECYVPVLIVELANAKHKAINGNEFLFFNLRQTIYLPSPSKCCSSLLIKKFYYRNFNNNDEDFLILLYKKNSNVVNDRCDSFIVKFNDKLISYFEVLCVLSAVWPGLVEFSLYFVLYPSCTRQRKMSLYDPIVNTTHKSPQ